MHRSHALNSSAATTTPLVQQAAHWMVLQHAGELDAQQRLALDRWRGSSPEHEQAWQAAQSLQQLFAQLPQGVGLETLSSAGRVRRKLVRNMLSLAITAPAAGWLWYGMGREWTADLRTAVGERRSETLADGSRLWLNTGSAVNVRFNAQERTLLLLAGEVLVETSQDPAAKRLPPLQVQVGSGRIEALGTRFQVREQGHGHWRVAVHEHAVRIHPAQAPGQVFTEVPAGQQTTFDAQGVSALEPVDDSMAAWREGVLVAKNMRLDTLVDEIARHRRGLLRCAPEVAALRISGVFQLSDTERTLDALAESLPIRVQRRTRFWVTFAARES